MVTTRLEGYLMVFSASFNRYVMWNGKACELVAWVASEIRPSPSVHAAVKGSVARIAEEGSLLDSGTLSSVPATPLLAR